MTDRCNYLRGPNFKVRLIHLFIYLFIFSVVFLIGGHLSFLSVGLSSLVFIKVFA